MKEAYAKWLCSTNIPYYEKGRLAKPCQRYCFNVQNMCPFFRPMDDNFGAQPLFHCRNVVQVTEERPDGYEDDDEHYYDDGIFKFFYLLNFQTMWTYFQFNIRN